MSHSGQLLLPLLCSAAGTARSQIPLFRRRSVHVLLSILWSFLPSSEWPELCKATPERTFVPGKGSSRLVFLGFLCLCGAWWRPTPGSITSFLTFQVELLTGGARGNFQQKEPVFPHLSINPRHKFVCCPRRNPGKAVWSIWKANPISGSWEGTDWAPFLPCHKRAGFCVVRFGMSPSEEQAP